MFGTASSVTRDRLIEIGESKFFVMSLPRVFLPDINDAVAQYHLLSKEEFLSRRQFRVVVRARQEAMWLGWKLTRRSQPEIARMLRRKHHTTVLHGIRVIDSLLKMDAEVVGDLLQLLPKFPNVSLPDQFR